METATATAHHGGTESTEQSSHKKCLRVLRASVVSFCFCLSAAAVAQETVGTGSPAVNAPGGVAAAGQTPKHAIELSGYRILGGARTQSQPNTLSIGRQNGFPLGQARNQRAGQPAES